VTDTAEGGHSSRARPGATASARLAAAVLALDALGGRRGTPPAELAGAEPAEALELTVNAGTLAGGTFVSQIATSATAMIDVRVPPGISLEDLEAEIDARVAPVPGASWRRVKAWEANWSGLEVPFVRAFADVVGEVRGRPAEPTVRLPASDASRWRALGVPAVCYGPQPTLSAGIDDHAEEQDVVDCASIYALAALGFLAG
jgi:succinyl-diaminopimelate desuccinylase